MQLCAFESAEAAKVYSEGVEFKHIWTNVNSNPLKLKLARQKTERPKAIRQFRPPFE